MAKARALDRRRKSIRNIRKITRTMELISTAQFKRAMDRATAATAYTRRITALVGHLAHSGLEVTHPLLAAAAGAETGDPAGAWRPTAGLCAGYNGSVLRLANARYHELHKTVPEVRIEMAGKRGISAFRFRKIPLAETFTHFNDKPSFRRGRRAGEPLLARFRDGAARPARRGLHEVRERQPSAGGGRDAAAAWARIWKRSEAEEDASASAETQYEFLPSAESILDEVVPASFKVKLFKCFLDAAVSEQIARMVAMKAATENADEHDFAIVDGLQPRPARTDHRRIVGNHRRSGSAERIKNDGLILEDSQGSIFKDQ